METYQELDSGIDRFLDYEEWYLKEVKDGLAEVKRGEIATDEEVAAKFRKWGADADLPSILSVYHRPLSAGG